jgi:hypothetical protein
MKLKWNVAALLLLSLLFAVPAYPQGEDVAVLVNPDNATTNLTVAELRKLFAGEKRTWPGGQPVRLFVRAPGSAERAALLKLLEMPESDYQKHWTSQVYRGEEQAEPVTLPSNGMQMEALRIFPGALLLMATTDLRAGMKVVKVDGHLPGSKGYPLR